MLTSTLPLRKRYPANKSLAGMIVARFWLHLPRASSVVWGGGGHVGWAAKRGGQLQRHIRGSCPAEEAIDLV